MSLSEEDRQFKNGAGLTSVSAPKSPRRLGGGSSAVTSSAPGQGLPARVSALQLRFAIVKFVVAQMFHTVNAQRLFAAVLLISRRGSNCESMARL